ncbi:MAG: isoprenylcysteine carboxylmethyltransferase family protein [Candidatus Acidiferrum sp.]
MHWDWLTQDLAWEWAERLWQLLMIVWIVLWLGAKSAKKRERWNGRAGYLILLLVGGWLLFGPRVAWEWMNVRLLPNVPLVWGLGLGVTAIGIGMAIWARLSLGTNWSGTVTLKKDHELVRKGLYRRIRHPIYTGILVGMVGTQMIQGHLKGWIGVGIILAGFYIKARREERFLSEEFGARFEEHARQTGMFLPKWT